MKLASLETLSCDAGWRPWLFVKATTDDGLVGWSEVTDSHGSPTGLAGVVSDLAPLVVGRDPRAVEAIHWDLYRRTRQSPGSIVHKALGGIENALLDLKAKSLGISVTELFGGPTRETVPLYWSHCGTTRARAWEVTGTPKLDSYDQVAALGCGGRRARLPRVQDEHRRAGPRASRPHARLRPRRRHRPKPDPRAARRPDTAARGIPGGDRREGAADRRPQLQPHDRGNRPRRAGTRAVRPRLARGRLVRRSGACPRAPPLTDPAVLGREPLRAPRFPAVPRGGLRWTSPRST